MNKFFDNLRELSTQRSIPIMSKNTEIFLSKLLNKHKPKICLEIGSAIGYSTIFTAQNISKRNWFVYSFEISYPIYFEALRNIKSSTTNNIRLYPMDFSKVELGNIIPTKIDFAFIDGQKSQYANYMMKIQDILSNTSIVLIDDVIKYHNKLHSLYEYLEKNQINYQIFQLDDDDWVMLIEN